MLWKHLPTFGGFSSSFQTCFFCKSQTVCRPFSVTKRPPHLFISVAPPRGVTSAVWRLRRACAGWWHRCLLLWAANPTGSQQEEVAAASVIIVWASGSCSRGDTPADGENVWQVTRGQQTSLTLNFCLFCTETPQNLPRLSFWEAPRRWGRCCFWSLNLGLSPPTDSFTNKVESLKLSLLCWSCVYSKRWHFWGLYACDLFHTGNERWCHLLWRQKRTSGRTW